MVAILSRERWVKTVQYDMILHTLLLWESKNMDLTLYEVLFVVG